MTRTRLDMNNVMDVTNLATDIFNSKQPAERKYDALNELYWTVYRCDIAHDSLSYILSLAGELACQMSRV